LTTSKPKIGTLFSLAIFIVFCLSAAGVSLYFMLSQTYYEWYQYALVVVLGPLGLGLFFRTILSYKVVHLGKGSIEVRLPTRFKTTTYKLSNVSKWSETEIKTLGGKYKELKILFDNKKKLQLSMQEHTNYPQVIKYLKKKCPKQFKG
jgi:cytochrome c biogenesis protein CcdA